MRYPSILVVLAVSVIQRIPNLSQSDIDLFVRGERTHSLRSILDNIGINGTKAQGASAGVVVASPSRANPNCEIPQAILIPGELVNSMSCRLLHMDSGFCHGDESIGRSVRELTVFVRINH